VNIYVLVRIPEKRILASDRWASRLMCEPKLLEDLQSKIEQNKKTRDSYVT
jgi:hypothetical protein